jgi:copper chaperone
MTRKTLTLSIDGMHCGACVRRAKAALQGVGGVQLDAVDVGSAKVTFNPEEATSEQIADALARIGFPARVAS